jgi:UPF0755 protein
MMRHVAANTLTLLILALVLLFGLITWAQSQFRAAGPLTEPLRFEVERGEGIASVSEKLAAAGAISNETLFRLGARYTGRDQGVRFGEYELAAGASMEAILDQLNQGGNVVRRIVMPEGWTSWQVVEALNARDDLTGEIAETPPEGSLAPAGYDYSRGDTRMSILDRMRAEQDRLLAEAWAGRDPDLPLETPEDLLILASIIERETGVDAERGVIAGLFVNRLRRGMRLQTDPTVIYGITEGRGTLGRGLRASELVAATPWNTYVIDGLPPTPIANPGREALFAAANPEPTEYLYFVADGSGGHAFARTLDEHNRNVAIWRRIERERAIEAQQTEGEPAPAE